MVVTKRCLLRFFFGIEILIFAGIYLFSTQGLQSLLRLRKENRSLAHEVKKLEQEVQELEQTVNEWKTNPFYLEKVAREQLHMAREKDEVYFRG